jgi:hypothetical protein
MGTDGNADNAGFRGFFLHELHKFTRIIFALSDGDFTSPIT